MQLKVLQIVLQLANSLAADAYANQVRRQEEWRGVDAGIGAGQGVVGVVVCYCVLPWTMLCNGCVLQSTSVA